MTKKDRVQIVISIHALREEGDRSGACLPLSRHDFYPRPPRGGRRFVMSEGNCRVIFLSTPSARRATQTLAGKT